MKKQWNWQHPDWPHFTWKARTLDSAAQQFADGFKDQNIALQRAGEEEMDGLRIEWLTNESLKTSAIEGEILDRDSIQASLLRRFGLRPSARRHGAAEEGIAEMMVSLYRDFAQPLDHETLCKWHIMLMSANPYIETIGGYRRQEDPMQVVSGPYGHETIHFEAPPAVRVPSEMDRFIDWFNRKTENADPAAALEAAAVAHLYFECIHPFEDGNGRIGRALAEKALARMLGRPTLLPLSAEISRQKKGYYAALNQASRSLDLSEWLGWFAQTALHAQDHGKQSLICVLAQARIFDQLQGQINARQEKALLRLFEAEPEGFEGGMSARNYQRITGASESSATRDLAALVGWGVLHKTGERRHTRYRLVLPDLDSLLDSMKTSASLAPADSKELNLSPAQKLRAEISLRANPIARESITKMVQWVAAEAQHSISLGVSFDAIAKCADQLHMSLFDIVDCEGVTALRAIAPVAASALDDEARVQQVFDEAPVPDGAMPEKIAKAYSRFCEENGCFFICALGTASMSECEVTGETGLCTEYVSVNVPEPHAEPSPSERQRRSAELILKVLQTLEKEAREEARGHRKPTGPKPDMGGPDMGM